jgi:YVTN family beta-propeller protein
MLMVLDNCEHLLDASAALVVELLGACPAVTLLATSREPIGVAGEVTWLVPSLSLSDEAIELFTDRARRARPEFTVTDHTRTKHLATVTRGVLPLFVAVSKDGRYAYVSNAGDNTISVVDVTAATPSVIDTISVANPGRTPF